MTKGTLPGEFAPHPRRAQRCNSLVGRSRDSGGTDKISDRGFHRDFVTASKSTAGGIAIGSSIAITDDDDGIPWT